MKRLISAVFLISLFSAAVAAEYFLYNVNMTYSQDAESAFSSTQSFFRTYQPVGNSAGKWRAGDTFAVQYSDGTIAKFELSSRGMTCIAGKCSWVTTLPLNDPPKEIISAPPKSSIGNFILTLASDNSYQSSVLLSNIIINNGFQQQRKWTITAGGPPPTGGSCAGNPLCQKPQ